jgi:hypothetical protein
MTKTVPVSKRALIQRINRSLKKDDEALKTARGPQASSTIGDFFIVSLDPHHWNAVLHKDVDIEHLGRKLGVLKPYERLSDD